MIDPYAVSTCIRPGREIDRKTARQNAFEGRNALVGELAAKGGEKAAAPFHGCLRRCDAHPAAHLRGGPPRQHLG